MDIGVSNVSLSKSPQTQSELLSENTTTSTSSSSIPQIIDTQKKRDSAEIENKANHKEANIEEGQKVPLFSNISTDSDIVKEKYNDLTKWAKNHLSWDDHKTIHARFADIWNSKCSIEQIYATILHEFIIKSKLMVDVNILRLLLRIYSNKRLKPTDKIICVFHLCSLINFSRSLSVSTTDKISVNDPD
jgi:hypothetical protein